MSLTSIRNLAFSLAFGLGCGLVFCAFTLGGGHAPWPIPLPLGVLILGFSAFLFAWGRRVKAMREKDRPEKKDQRRMRRRISPLQAARVAVLAQACSRCGAWLAGFFGLCAALFWRTGETSYVREQVLAAGLAAASSAVLTWTGWAVERWCIVDSDDDGPGPQASPTVA